jgi:hypothetical protein
LRQGKQKCRKCWANNAITANKNEWSVKKLVVLENPRMYLTQRDRPVKHIMQRNQMYSDFEPAEPTPFLTEKQAAERLALSPYTLRNWRSSGTGPPTLKLGGAVRYHLPALDAWTLGQVA